MISQNKPFNIRDDTCRDLFFPGRVEWKQEVERMNDILSRAAVFSNMKTEFMLLKSLSEKHLLENFSRLNILATT